MADTQGTVPGTADVQAHPSYWDWLMSGAESSTNGSPNGNAHVNERSSMNGHGSLNGNGSVNGNGPVKGNGSSNGDGSANGHGSANGNRRADHEAHLQKLALEGMTPTGLARRLGRR